MRGMGLIVKQDGQRSRLQEKITAELREKSQKTTGIENEPPDMVDDMVYQRDLKQAGAPSVLGWWLLAGGIFVAIVALFLSM